MYSIADRLSRDKQSKIDLNKQEQSFNKLLMIVKIVIICCFLFFALMYLPQITINLLLLVLVIIFIVIILQKKNTKQEFAYVSKIKDLSFLST